MMKPDNGEPPLALMGVLQKLEVSAKNMNENDDDDTDNDAPLSPLQPSWVSSLPEFNSDLRRLARACQLVIGGIGKFN